MYEGLLEIFAKYGYYKESLRSLTLKGKDGAEQIANILETFRKEPPKEIAGVEVVAIEDYLTSKRTIVATGEEQTIDLPRSNVLKYHLANGAWFCLRPSGTEPKAKFYFGVKGTSLEESEKLVSELEHTVMSIVNQIVNL